MIETFLTPQLALLVALGLAIGIFFTPSIQLNALFLFLESIFIFIYYFFDNLLTKNNMGLMILIIFICAFIYILSYYFTKATNRKWQKRNNWHASIVLVTLFFVYINNDLISLFKMDIEIIKHDLIIDDNFMIYLIYFIVISIVCSIITLNNKDIKRK